MGSKLRRWGRFVPTWWCGIRGGIAGRLQSRDEHQCKRYHQNPQHEPSPSKSNALWDKLGESTALDWLSLRRSWVAYKAPGAGDWGGGWLSPEDAPGEWWASAIFWPSEFGLIHGLDEWLNHLKRKYPRATGFPKIERRTSSNEWVTGLIGCITANNRVRLKRWYLTEEERRAVQRRFVGLSAKSARTRHGCRLANQAGCVNNERCFFWWVLCV